MKSSDSDDTCRISCRLEVLPGNRVVDQLMNAHAFGFDRVSLPGRLLDSYLDQLRACLADSPLPLGTLSLGFAGSLVSPHRDLRIQCRDSLLKLFDVCAELGIEGFNMAPVLTQDNPDRITEAGTYESVTAAQDALLLEQLPDSGDEARKRGVTLLIEPVNRYESHYLNNVLHAANLCTALNHNHVGITADFFHMQIEELSIPASIQQAGRWIKHVHVAENTRVEPGPGSLDFLPGFRALKGIGYAGMIEVECHTLSGPARDVLPRSVEYLRALWAQA